MKKRINSKNLVRVFPIFLLGFLLVLKACSPTIIKSQSQIKRGENLYMKYCVDCHDSNAKGIAEFQTKYDSIDLTKINYRRQVEEFPVKEIALYLDGRQHYKDFGDRVMPMWGVSMMEKENNYNPDTARVNLGALISYLITLQVEE